MKVISMKLFLYEFEKITKDKKENKRKTIKALKITS